MKKFENVIELKEFLNSKKLRRIDSGSEGVFYYSLVDKLGYKIFFIERIEDYKPEDIIKASDVVTDAFLFPLELFVIDGKLVGYKTNFVMNNMFDNDIYSFDFKTFKKAYKDFKIEVANLSKQKIEIYDLFANMLFDGKKLYAIDTCAYEKSNDKKLLKINNDNLEYSVTLELENMAIFNDIDIETREELKMSVLEYIDYIERRVKKEKIKLFGE